MKTQYAVTSTGVPLQWNILPPAGNAKAPAVLVWHPGGFKTGELGPLDVAQDLAAAGFLAIPAEYRLAPPHTQMNAPHHVTPGQNTVGDDGHYPAQTDDCRAAIRAARAHPRCNGQVYCVGGSAGASHALYWAARGTAGDDRPDRVVLLSGPYKFDDEAHLAIDYPPGETNFHEAVCNYVNTPDTFPTYSPEALAQLRDASPLTYVEDPAQLPPIFALCSSDDAGGVDVYQFPDLLQKFAAIGLPESAGGGAAAGTYKQMIVPVSVQTHAFKYWAQVKADVITWLQAP